MTVFISGAAGALGTELKKRYQNTITPTHEELDIRNRSDVFEFFKTQPDIDVIIHLTIICRYLLV